MRPNPVGDLIEGLGKVNLVDAHTEDVHQVRWAGFLCGIDLCHCLPAALSSTARVSRAAFSQEKRLTFS